MVSQPHGDRRPLVLLAEDDAELRFILKKALNREGYDIEEISDLKALERHLRQLAVSDIAAVLVSEVHMSGGNTFDLVEKANAHTFGLPIIFVTSARDPEVTKRGLALGARKVFSKPVDMHELKLVIRQMVAARDATCVKSPRGAI